MSQHDFIAGMRPDDYAELLDHLRKDLLLDATTDVLPGTIAQALANDTTPMNSTALGKVLLALGINFGTVSFTFTASSSSPAVNVSHGLGVTPGAVFLQAASSAFLDANINSSNSSVFNATAFVTTNTTTTGTFGFYWVAFK